MDLNSSSSDEEDDHQTLINQHERKLPQSTFEIGGERGLGVHEIKNKILPRNFTLNKRYLLAICISLFCFFLFFSVDMKSLFSNISTMKIDSVSERMRESELKALFLLKQQQIQLLDVWNLRNLSDVGRNYTVNNNNNNNNNNNTENLNLVDDEDFRSVLLKQIRLNKEIQQVLLSTHRTGNLSDVGDDNVDTGGVVGNNGCRKVDQVVERKTIDWKPKSNKYLFAICLSGQMSNHLICLEKHMFFAALLKRVLVIPSLKVDYQYNRILDIEHINKCFNRKVAITFEEFAEANKKHMSIDRFICYVSSPIPCFVDEDHVKKLKKLGLSVAKPESPWVEDVKEPKKRTVEDVLAKFSTGDEVLAVGDLFYADVETEWITQPGGPLSHTCKTLIEPSRLIVLTAQRFIQTFLGKDFIALHFRRHGFLKFCNVKAESCFFPIPQAANCITRVAERASTPVIYLSTDAAETETDLLQSLTMLNGRIIPLVKRPARNSAEKWDALLYRNGIEGDSQVEAMLDKTICAMSSVFIGASGSTFTEDILRLRKDWRTASVCDEYLCQNERPNFIAGNE